MTPLHLRPHPFLVQMALERGHQADLTHSKKELIHAIESNIPLRPSPTPILRAYLHRFIETNPQILAYMEKECAQCFRAEQTLCPPWKVILDCYQNLSQLETM